MTEIVRPEPIPASVYRMCAVTEMTTMQTLLGHLDVDGLNVVRGRLRHDDLAQWCTPTPMAVMRANVLDATCRLLVAHEFAPEMYFVDAGDIDPPAPDDVSELDGVEP